METPPLRMFLSLAVFAAAPILNGCGSQSFALTPGPSPQGLQAETSERLIHAFRGIDDGSYPAVGLIHDAAGNLYGATDSGGDGKCLIGCSIIFELVPGLNGHWNERVLHNFNGEYGISQLAFDRGGNLYGAAALGGTGSQCVAGCGFIFELAHSSGGRWIKKDLYDFHGYDGAGPSGPLLFDGVGNLYGTASGGGLEEVGVIFQLARSSASQWQEHILHQFKGTDGSQPAGGLTVDAVGNMYGATVQGGLRGCSGGCGTVFQLTRAGRRWTFKSIHAFSGKGGFWPPAGVVVDTVGNLYGTTVYGGLSDYGVVFELAASSSWSEKVLHSFTGGSDGGSPNDAVTLDGSGNIYGTTELNGVDGKGIAFELQPIQSGAWKEVVLHSFSGGRRDGSYPLSGLTFDRSKRLYGTTRGGGPVGKGVVYAVTP